MKVAVDDFGEYVDIDGEPGECGYPGIGLPEINAELKYFQVEVEALQTQLAVTLEGAHVSTEAWIKKVIDRLMAGELERDR